QKRAPAPKGRCPIQLSVVDQDVYPDVDGAGSGTRVRPSRGFCRVAERGSFQPDARVATSDLNLRVVGLRLAGTRVIPHDPQVVGSALGDRDLVRPAEREVADNTLAGADRDLVRLGQPNTRVTAGVRVDDQPRLRRRATALRVSHPDTGVTAHQLAGLRRRVRRHDDLVRRTGQRDAALVVITEDLQRSAAAVTAAGIRLVLVVVDPNPSNLQCRWRLVRAIEVIELDAQVPGRHILDVPAAATFRIGSPGVFEPEFPVDVPADETVLASLVLEREIVPLRHVDAGALEPLLLNDLIFIVITRVVHEGHRLHVPRTRVLHEVVFAVFRPAIRLRPDQDNGVVIVPVARRGRLTCGRRPDVRTGTNLPTTTAFGVVEVP